MYYGQNHRAAMEAAKVGSKRRCAECKELFLQKDVRRDHIVPCGPLRGLKDLLVFCERLFYGKIQVLCKADHAKKTALEAAARRKK